MVRSPRRLWKYADLGRAMKWLLSAFALIVAGCSSSFPETSNRISGQWAGQGLEIHDSATVASVVVSDACSHLLFPAPVAIGSAGNFSAEGVIAWATWSPAIGRRAQIVGRLKDDTMHVDLREITFQGTWGAYVHYTLHAGQAPDWTGWACVI